MKNPTTWWWSAVVNVKSSGENTKREGTDPKRHLKSSISKSKTLKTLQNNDSTLISTLGSSFYFPSTCSQFSWLTSRDVMQ
jgi:hypothetical protein